MNGYRIRLMLLRCTFTITASLNKLACCYDAYTYELFAVREQSLFVKVLTDRPRSANSLD